MRKFLLLLLLLAGGTLFAVRQFEYQSRDFRRLTAMTARVFDREHYAHEKMSVDFSRRIFDKFIDSLDPGKMFFSQADVRTLSGQRDTIGFDLQNGEYDLAFRGYDLLRRRYGEYREFTRELFKKGVDFSGNEEFVLDRKELPRPADDDALHALWKQKLTNDLLVLKLIDRAEKEELEERKKAGNAQDAAPRTRKTPEERVLQRQRDVGNDIDQRDKIDVLGQLLDAMAGAYGAHSSYDAPKMSEDFDIQMSLSLSGIGATLTTENGYIKIVELVPGGPAALSGKLKINDRIVSVTQQDGETTDLIDMPVGKAVQFIRGKAGTRVTLDILSGEGASARTFKVLLVRDKINLSESAAKGETRTIEEQGKKAKVGILTLPRFYMDFDGVQQGKKEARRASDDVAKILKDFRKQNISTLVIDLRNNGGGSFPDSILLSGLFLSGEPVVQVRYGNLQQESYCDEDRGCIYSGPMVILISKMSASAAEIFTAAMRDADRAVVVGDSRTFGKGTVLNVYPLDRYTALLGNAQFPAGTATMESAMFYRPSGGSVQQLGIASDIRLPSLTEEMKIGEMFLEHHLPWDSIEPLKYDRIDPALAKKIPILRQRSRARIAAAPAYQRLLKKIEIYRKLRDRKSVSLNEKKRWEDFRREKKVSDEVDKTLDEDSAGSGKDRKKEDPILDEALHIAADLYWFRNVK